MASLLEIPSDKHQIVEVILKASTLYKCIFVTKEATTTEISKQFKKVSILVHPDKNVHPKASEAFKKVGEAKRILTDETARRRYDQTGSTSDRPAPQEYFRGGGFSGGPHDGPTAEDIFEAFFGNQGTRSRRGPGRPFFFDTDSGPFFQGGPTFHQYPHQHQQERQFYTRRASPQSSASFMTPLFGLVAFLILLFVLNFVANRATPGPVFSLRKSQEHSVPHYTKEGLKYWLSPGYYDSSTLLSNSHQRTMDNNVYNAWLRFREQECSQDLSQARRGAQPARPKSCAQYDELRNLKNSREW